MKPGRLVLLGKSLCWSLGVFQLARLLGGVYYQANYMGPNPLDKGLNLLGWWALFFLTLTLSWTPVSQWTRQPWWKQLQRLTGLFSFAFVVPHLFMYVYFDQEHNWSYILPDLWDRKFILLGFVAFLILLVLAITSTQNWQRRLGVNWKKLHRLTYIAAILGITHFTYRMKVGLQHPEVKTFAIVITLLLLARILPFLKSDSIPPVSKA